MAADIRALYVDDEEVLLDVGKFFLELSGNIAVDTAVSAKEAENAIGATRYDAVVCDYQMPMMNGIDFLKRLRSQGNQIPFILFTGRGREEIVIEALNSGADFYMQKGGNPEAQFIELEHKIKESVARRRAEGLLKQSEMKYRNLFENIFAPFAVYRYICDGNGEVDHWILEDANTPGLRLLGKDSLDEVKGKNETELYGPENRGARLPLIREVKRTGRPTIKEMHFDWNDTYQLATLFPLDSEHFVSMVLDITEMRRARRQVEISEAKFRSIYEMNQDAILLTNPDGQVLALNQAAQDLLNASDGVIERSGQGALLRHDERLWREIDEGAASGKSTVEMTYRRPDGSTLMERRPSANSPMSMAARRHTPSSEMSPSGRRPRNRSN